VQPLTVDALQLTVGGAAGLAIGFAVGFRLGSRARGRRRRYWLLGASAFLGGFAVSFAGTVTARPWATVAGVALIAGGLTGLRYGYERPLGSFGPRRTPPE